MSRFTETLKEVNNAIFKKRGFNRSEIYKMLTYPAYYLRMNLQLS